MNRWMSWRSKSRARGATERFTRSSFQSAEISAVVVGHGPAGQTVTRLLRESGIVPTVVETNIDTVEEINAAGGRALFGDATRSEILEAAGIGSAKYLIITVPKAEVTLQVIQSGREVNPGIEVMARASYLRDREGLETAGASSVCVDEAEAAVSLAEEVMRRMKVPEEQIASTVNLVKTGFVRRI